MQHLNLKFHSFKLILLLGGHKVCLNNFFFFCFWRNLNFKSSVILARVYLLLFIFSLSWMWFDAKMTTEINNSLNFHDKEPLAARATFKLDLLLFRIYFYNTFFFIFTFIFKCKMSKNRKLLNSLIKKKMFDSTG